MSIPRVKRSAGYKAEGKAKPKHRRTQIMSETERERERGMARKATMQPGKRSCSADGFVIASDRHVEISGGRTGSDEMPCCSVAEFMKDTVAIGLLHLGVDVVA